MEVCRLAGVLTRVRRNQGRVPPDGKPNDQQELQPALDHLGQLPPPLGRVDQLLGDHGYGSEANVKAYEPAHITPLLATGRAVPHPTLEER